MKEISEETRREIFSETFEQVSIAMLNVLEKFSEEDQRLVLEEASRSLLMFSMDNLVRQDATNEDITRAVNSMVKTVHKKILKEATRN